MARTSLPHLDSSGSARMVDVGSKPPTHRVAMAEAFVRISPEALRLVKEGNLKKGDALAVARIAGIAASKKASELIPLAHPIALTHAAVDAIIESHGVRIETRVETVGSTGVELEALVAASTAALTVYDMVKAHDRGMVIERVQLLMKAGGRSGTYRRAERRGETVTDRPDQQEDEDWGGEEARPVVLIPVLERAMKTGLNISGIKSRFVETCAGAIHLYDGAGRGELPPVVILHGIGSSATPYWQLLTKLKRRARRVMAADNAGHGFSDGPTPLTAEIVIAALTELLDRELSDREPAVLFGNSMGGALAVRYALSRPEKVSRLILSSPAGAPMKPEEMEGLLALFTHQNAQEAGAFVRRLYHQAPWYTPLIAGDIQRLFARPQLRSLLASLGPEHLFTAEQVKSLKLPVLLIWGQSDKIMPRSNLSFYRAALPEHAVIEEPAGFGHCPYLDDPDGLASRMLAFIAS